MKKLEDYKGQKIAIHFPTYELWLRRKEINQSDNCKNLHWNYYKEKTCYFTDDFESGEVECLDYAKEKGYTILQVTDFLEYEFIYGQEYEFSDDEDFRIKTIAIYGCINPIKERKSEKHICFIKDGIVTFFKYARKINTERTEAITTIKELVSKHSINQNEVF